MGDSFTARVKMQCANRPFWSLVSKYTISKFFRFILSKINRISTEFFFKYKEIAKIIFKIFSKFFFYDNFFLQIFFCENFYYRVFFGENFSFHKNISAKIFFTIFSRISFVFDVCETMYFANFFVLQFWCTEKKILIFFAIFFFSDEREYQI